MLVRYMLGTLLCVVFLACSEGAIEVSPTDDQELYFPPRDSEDWETISPHSLDWDLAKLADLNEFLMGDNTKSFMILVDGKIVVEEYYNGHSVNDTWRWNSAGKTLVTSITGISEQEGYIDISNPVDTYLGQGWTAMDIDSEQHIEPYHLLTMTSGINDQNQLIVHRNLTYLADAGNRWSYSNVFQMLIEVVASATGDDFETYFEEKLADKIGMQGFWNFGAIFKIYHSTTRSMARYGLLALHQGTWEQDQVIAPSFFEKSIAPSQSLNPSYGYMWWLNGKSQYMLPGSQEVHEGSLIPQAPGDMYAAMGANDQRLYVIPSKNMVVVRMGESSEISRADFALSNFDHLFWDMLMDVID